MLPWYFDYWGNLPIENSKISKKRLAQFNNNKQFQLEFNKLFNLAMNTFKWNNLPDTVDERWINRSFILSGKALWAREDGGYLGLAGGANSELNIYGYPVRAYGWGANGWNKQYNLYLRGASEIPMLKDGLGWTRGASYDAVLGYYSSTAYPLIHYIYAAAIRMSDATRSIDTAANNLKTPYIISTDESQVNSVQEALKQKDDNLAAVITSGNLGIDSLKVWPTGADPNILTALWDHKIRIANETKELFGQKNNENQDKKERMLVDEVNANNQATYDNVDQTLVWLNRFCEDVNNAFGLDISVELRSKSEEYIDQYITPDVEEFVKEEDDIENVE